MIGAAATLARPVEPRVRQERAGFRAAALPAGLPVCQQIAEGGAQLIQSRRPDLFRPFGLDCGRHCLDAFIQPPAAAGKPDPPRVPVRGVGVARSRGAVLLEATGAFVVVLAVRGPGSAATTCSRCCGGSGGAVPGWLKRLRWAAFSWARLRMLWHAASRLCVGLRPGRAG